MFTEDFDVNESTADYSTDANSAAAKMFDEILPSHTYKPQERSKTNDAPPDVASHTQILDSAGRAAVALDSLADNTAGLSKIEKTALKDLQRAVLTGDYSKIAALVKDFDENPKAFTNIAAALKRNLEGNGITVTYEIVEPKTNSERTFPPYGVLTFGLKSGQTEATLKIRTTDSASGTDLSKSVARALSQMVIEQYDLKRMLPSSGPNHGDLGVSQPPKRRQSHSN